MTSEATHIYDPSTTLREAYRTLAGNWKQAFEIGKVNMISGTVPITFKRLIQLIVQFKVRPVDKPETSKSARL